MLVAVVSGCSFLKLNKSVTAFDASVSISGTISSNLNNTNLSKIVEIEDFSAEVGPLGIL